MKLLRRCHLYLGLGACLVLTILSITGTVMAFENELNRAVNPALLRVDPKGRHPLPWEALRRGVEVNEPAWRVQRIYMPMTGEDSTYVRLVSRASATTTREIYIDQYTGEILGRKEAANQLLWNIHELHVTLAAGKAGSRLVFAASIALLLLAASGLWMWWPRRVYVFQRTGNAARTSAALHRALGFWSSAAMLLFAITGINLHLQTGGELFTMMDDRSERVDLPGHGVTADGMLQAAAEAIPGARTMRISFWGGARPVLVQLRFPEDHTPAGRSAVTLDPKTGRVLSVVSNRTAPLLYRALVQWNREIHTGTIFGLLSRIPAAVCSALLASLAISGAMIWVNRKLALARGQRLAHERKRRGVAETGVQI